MSEGGARKAVSGHLFFLYAYEAGFEIDLEKARTLCEASDAPGIAGLRPSPPHLQYRPKPLVVPAGTVEADARGNPCRLDAAVKIFDFGALSVTLTLPVRDLFWDEYRAAALALSSHAAVRSGQRRHGTGAVLMVTTSLRYIPSKTVATGGGRGLV